MHGDSSWQQKLCAALGEMAQWRALCAAESSGMPCSGRQGREGGRGGGGELGNCCWTLTVDRHGGGMQAMPGGLLPPAWAERPDCPSGSPSAPQGVILWFTVAPGYLLNTTNHSPEGFWFLKDTRDPQWGHVEGSLFFTEHCSVTFLSRSVWDGFLSW